MLPAHSQVGKKKDLPARSEVEKVGTETDRQHNQGRKRDLPPRAVVVAAETGQAEEQSILNRSETELLEWGWRYMLPGVPPHDRLSRSGMGKVGKSVLT